MDRAGLRTRRHLVGWNVPVKPLTELAAGSRVLIDANVFIYAANRTSNHCRNFLGRCAQEELHGVTTFEALSDVCHRLMLQDALAAGIIQRPTAPQLRRLRRLVPQHATYWPSVVELLDMNLLLLELDETRFHAQTIRDQHGLLTNDSLILAAAQSYRITNLASRDDDFDEVPWLTVYKPEDIP